ncbi:MAG: hypothetical protein CM15mP116_08740 [Synechococcus sp.]|nr:MAG: hypothetical protein CM15mP116_08740 [Synechococcus sp.]
MIWDAEKKTPGVFWQRGSWSPPPGNTGIAPRLHGGSTGLQADPGRCLSRCQTNPGDGGWAVPRAQIFLTEAAKGMPGAIAKAKGIAGAMPRNIYARSVRQPSEPRGFTKRPPAPGKLGATAAGPLMSSWPASAPGGTITGVSPYIKNQAGKAIESVGVEPTHSPVIPADHEWRSGQARAPQDQGIGAGFIPKNLDLSVVVRSNRSPMRVDRHGTAPGSGGKVSSLESPVVPRLQRFDSRNRTPTPAKPLSLYCPTWQAVPLLGDVC